MSNSKTSRADRLGASKGSLRKGGIYLLVTLVIFAALVWFIPDVLNFDLAGFMSSPNMVAAARAALGLFFLVILVLSMRYTIASFTLEGESWRQGFQNALRSHVFSRDGISILLLFGGGVALIAWGLVDLFA